MARTQITENQEVPDTITDSNVAANAAIQLSKLGTGNLSLINQASVIFKELTANGTDSVTVEAPDDVTTSYTLKLPTAQGGVNTALTNDGSGNLSWVAGSGTVNSGTVGRLSLYNTSTNAVSDTYVQNTKNITLTIATQGSRTQDLAITIPNPGNAVTSANVITDTDTNSYTLSGTYTLPNALTITATTNQLVLSGPTRTATITAPQPATSSRIYTFPDLAGNYSVIGDSGTQTIGGSKTFSSALTINPTTNQLVLGGSSGNTNTISSTAPATSSRTWTIPDLATSPTFAALEGTQTFTGAKTFNSATLGGDMNANSHKITSLTNGSAASDAAAFGQIVTTAVVQFDTDTQDTTTSTTYQSSSLTASIIPSTSSRRIKISVATTGANSSSSTDRMSVSIFRGSTDLAATTDGFAAVQIVGNVIACPLSMVFIDSPASASSVTYTVKFRAIVGGGATMALQANSRGVIILEEII